jgi:hypothetical protein
VEGFVGANVGGFVGCGVRIIIPFPFDGLLLELLLLLLELGLSRIVGACVGVGAGLFVDFGFGFGELVGCFVDFPVGFFVDFGISACVGDFVDLGFGAGVVLGVFVDFLESMLDLGEAVGELFFSDPLDFVDDEEVILPILMLYDFPGRSNTPDFIGKFKTPVSESEELAPDLPPLLPLLFWDFFALIVID